MVWRLYSATLVFDSSAVFLKGLALFPGDIHDTFAQQPFSRGDLDARSNDEPDFLYQPETRMRDGIRTRIRVSCLRVRSARGV